MVLFSLVVVVAISTTTIMGIPLTLFALTSLTLIVTLIVTTLNKNCDFRAILHACDVLSKSLFYKSVSYEIENNFQLVIIVN